MPTLIVVRNPKDWPIRIPGVEIVSSKAYLTDACYAGLRGAKVFNLSRSYGYQSNGYYVSLLAEARGHKPLPSVATLQDMRSAAISRAVTEELDDLIQKMFRDIQSPEFVFSIYFGKNVAQRYDRLALRLYNMFEAPLLRAYFVRKKEWELKRITPISTSEIPESHHDFVVQRALDYFSRKRIRATTKKNVFSYDLAILHDPDEATPPSDERALQRFMKAAEECGMRPELITRNDYPHVAEFDALFIRATTGVNHYTYQFARRAEAEGLAVMDDPKSIIRCCNKVFLTEALRRQGVAIPRTLILHRDRFIRASRELSFPCIIKLPDSYFSLGVTKVDSRDDFEDKASQYLAKSELIIAQEFIPTPFDWRIGVIDNEAFYACKYFMAPHHWQILKHSTSGRVFAGRVQAVPLKKVPDRVVTAAVRASHAVGRGLYGVDLKEAGRRCLVIEVNDNPNIEAGYEDSRMRVSIYRKIMRSLRRRIDDIKRGSRP